MHGHTLQARQAQGPGRISAALWDRGRVRTKLELAERAEEWQGAAAQQSRLLSAAFPEHRPAKPPLVQRRKRGVLLFGGKPTAPTRNFPPSSQTEGSLSSKNAQQGSPEHMSLR